MSGRPASPIPTGRHASIHRVRAPPTCCTSTRSGSRLWSSTTRSTGSPRRRQSRPGWRPRLPHSGSWSRPSEAPVGAPSGGARPRAWPGSPAPYRPFGERLRCVLFRVGEETPRDDDALARLLDTWPVDIALALELRHASWLDDAVHDRLRERGVALVTIDADDLDDPPFIRRTGSLLYVRLRRTSYSPADLEAWSARLAPFLDDGVDACVFLRHDADGASAIGAQTLLTRRSSRT